MPYQRRARCRTDRCAPKSQARNPYAVVVFAPSSPCPPPRIACSRGQSHLEAEARANCFWSSNFERLQAIPNNSLESPQHNMQVTLKRAWCNEPRRFKVFTCSRSRVRVRNNYKISRTGNSGCTNFTNVDPAALLPAPALKQARTPSHSQR